MAANRLHILFLLVWVLQFGCTAGPGREPEPLPQSTCDELDQLFGTIEVFKNSFSGQSQTSPEAAAQQMVHAFEQQLAQKNDSCNYLDQNHHPEAERFEFVPLLTDWIVRDTFAEGIYHLIRLRSAFAEDPAITEYFSEELAGLALHNPHAYLQYLRDHPGQEQMVLNSTRWATTDLETVREAFVEAGAGDNILLFLQNLRNTRSPTP